MTREHVKALLPVLQAYAEGKEILLRGKPLVSISEDLDFDGDPEDYSIKPEPMEIEVMLQDGTSYGYINSQPGTVPPQPGWTRKKFREVTD